MQFFQSNWNFCAGSVIVIVLMYSFVEEFLMAVLLFIYENMVVSEGLTWKLTRHVAPKLLWFMMLLRTA